MGTAYATRRDLYRFGLPRGTLGGQGRVIESATAATDMLVLEDHGFETGDEVLVRAAEGGTLSAPLVAGTTYYALRFSESTFKLSATECGDEIDLTSDGVSMIVSTPLPFDDVLEVYSRFVDGCLSAHRLPLEADDEGKFPTVVTAIVAELAAKKLQTLSGVTSVSVSEAEVAAKAQLERWAAGVPLRDARATGPANIAIVARARATTSDPRGWGSGSLP